MFLLATSLSVFIFLLFWYLFWLGKIESYCSFDLYFTDGWRRWTFLNYIWPFTLPLRNICSYHLLRRLCFPWLYLLAPLSESLAVHVGLFLGPLFCPIGLWVCFYASTVLVLLLWICSVFWNQYWCLQRCSFCLDCAGYSDLLVLLCGCEDCFS